MPMIVPQYHNCPIFRQHTHGDRLHIIFDGMLTIVPVATIVPYPILRYGWHEWRVHDFRTEKRPLSIKCGQKVLWASCCRSCNFDGEERIFQRKLNKDDALISSPLKKKAV